LNGTTCGALCQIVQHADGDQTTGRFVHGPTSTWKPLLPSTDFDAGPLAWREQPQTARRHNYRRMPPGHSRATPLIGAGPPRGCARHRGEHRGEADGRIGGAEQAEILQISGT
jgi:hypothetical protein